MKNVSVNGDLKTHPGNPTSLPQQPRQTHVFSGYSNHPPQPHSSMPSMPPHIPDAMDPHHIGRQHATTIGASASASGSSLPTINPSESSPEKRVSSLLQDNEPRKRKFILVEDMERNSRVRVKVNLDGVDINEIPDSYRDANAVYPRSYYPSQMLLSPRSDDARRARGRFPVHGGLDSRSGIETRCSVKVPGVETDEMAVSMRGLTNAVGQKEEKLNDLGYRMSWTQSRVFAGRVIFLQRSRKSRESCNEPETMEELRN